MGGGGGGGDSTTQTTTPTQPTTPTTTTPTTLINTVLTSSSILPTAGGLLHAQSDDAEVNGASVEVPAGAVSETITMSIGVVNSLPQESPFGQSPIGKLFGIEPSGQKFTEEATLTLPIPPGLGNIPIYIGRWNPVEKKWENLGGTASGDYISTKIDHLSIYGVFYGGKSEVKIVNQSGPQADLGINLLYVSGPALPPNLPPGTPYPSYRPLPEGGITLKDGESWILSLLPGTYHFLVSYPHPQPGVANSLFFTIPQLASGADDGQIDQTITITLNGATSTNPNTDPSISFPGYQATPGSNRRPVIGCTAFAPAGVVVVDRITGTAPVLAPTNPNASRLINVGPIKMEQLSSPGALTLRGQAHDPEGSPLDLFWTWEEGTLPTYDQILSDGTKDRAFSPNPLRARVYTVSLTVYDQYGLFDQCSWFITVQANAKPIIKSTADDIVIDFGRLDGNRRLFAPQPAVDAVPISGSAAAPPIPNPPGITTIPFGNLCAYVGNQTYLRTLPGDPVDPAHVDPRQYPAGMTCVFAIIGDADGDDLLGGFRIPEPIMGRGTLYAAVPVPNAVQGGAFIPLLDIPPKSPPRTVADILPNGLAAGSIIDTYNKMDAYNATISFLANRGLFPVTPPLSNYNPVLPLPQWPSNPALSAVRGPQALPIIWEAPDDPDPANETHDCVTHRFALSYDPLCQIRHGGTVYVQSWVTDTFSPIQRSFALVAFPDQNTVFPGGFTFASITPNPADPAPNQGVTVTACISPPTEGVNISFSIVGTDGYSKSQTIATGDGGCASFYIPGAKQEGTVDVVTVKLGDLTSTVTYTF